MEYGASEERVERKGIRLHWEASVTCVGRDAP